MNRLILLITFLYSAKAFCLNYTLQDTDGIEGAYFSPDGKEFGISHYTSNFVHFWDKFNKTIVYRYNYGIWTGRVTYSKNGAYIAIVGGKTVVHILNATNYAYMLSLRPEGVGYVVSKADFRYDDKMILVCGSNNTIHIYNVPSWTLNRSIVISYSANTDCEYASDDKFVVVGAYGAITFDAAGNMKNTYSGINIKRVTVHPDGQTFIATLGTAQYMEGNWNGTYTNHSIAFNSLDCDYSEDGNYLTIGGGNSELNIYNATTKVLLKTINANTGNNLFGIRLSADSRYLLSAEATTGKVYLYYRSDYYHFLNCS